MQEFNIEVNKDMITPLEPIEVKTGSYNIYKLKFVFSSEYENLTKKALIVFEDDKSLEIAIIDNELVLPLEFFEEEYQDTKIIVGVYAYSINEEEKIELRYSPRPFSIIPREGSYDKYYSENAENLKKVTTSDLEIYYAKFNELYLKTKELCEKCDKDYEEVKEEIKDLKTTKQDKLKAGKNITIDEDNTINADIKDGTKNYNELDNKPSINNIELTGNKTLEELGFKEYDDSEIKQEINNLDTEVERLTENVNNIAGDVSSIDGKVTRLNNIVADINTDVEKNKADIVEIKLDVAGNKTKIEEVESALEDVEGELTQEVARVEEIANSAYDLAEEAEIIAKGRAKGYVFTTKEDMDLWLQDDEHTKLLNQGDNLYIIAKDVPDYWWDGTKVEELETQKVELTEYIKDTDYATSTKGGTVKINTLYAINIAQDGTISNIPLTYDIYINRSSFTAISKGTLENVIAGKKLINRTQMEEYINSLNGNEVAY